MFLDHGGWARDDLLVLIMNTQILICLQGQYNRTMMFIYLGLVHCEIGLNYI